MKKLSYRRMHKIHWHQKNYSVLTKVLFLFGGIQKYIKPLFLCTNFAEKIVAILKICKFDHL